MFRRNAADVLWPVSDAEAQLQYFLSHFSNELSQ